MYIGELAGRTTDRPANQAPHSSSSHCVHQTREPARPTTGRLGVGERCGRVGYTRKRECNIPAAYTIFTVKYAVGREKRGENRLTLDIIVLILLLFLFSLCRWISIEKKEIDLGRWLSGCVQVVEISYAYVFKRQVSFCSDPYGGYLAYLFQVFHCCKLFSIFTYTEPEDRTW